MSRRVIFFNRFYWPDTSATAQILTDLAGDLAASGWRVRVVTSRLEYVDAKRRLAPREQAGGVDILRLWSTRFGRGSLPGRLLDYVTIYLSFIVYLLRHATPGDVVVVKTDPPLLSLIGWLARFTGNFRLVSWCQDLFPEVAEAGLPGAAAARPLLAALRRLRNVSLAGSDCTAVLSADMRGYLQREGIAGRVVCLPNWAIQPPPASAGDVLRLRREWGLEGRLVLCYSGNLGRVHDWTTLRDALPLLESVPELTLLFIGGGARQEAIRQELQRHPGLQSVFLPYQPREMLAASLAVADIHWLSLLPAMTPFVFPSKFYGILCAGRPVLFIGDPQCELGRTVAASGCGRCVRSGDPDGLAAAVRELASDSKLRDAMGAKARALGEGPCSRKAALARWRQTLDTIGKA